MRQALIDASLPTADEYAASGRRRMRSLYVLACLLSAAAAVCYAGIFNQTTLIVPLVMLLALAAPVLLWRYPQLGPCSLVAAVCLFELFPSDWPDALTDRVPFFWNVNTIVQRYAGADFHGFPLNVLELLLITMAVTSTVKAVYSRTVNVRAGALAFPIGIYVCFVGYAWVHGVATGGEFKVSLDEVRSQFYLLIAYLIGVNSVRSPRDLARIQWIMVAAIGFKGILYTVRWIRFVKFGGMALPDQGIGSHEEAFLFDCFILMLLVFLLCNAYPRLRTAMWALLPFVLMGDLACHRRAATAALLVAAPIMLMAVYRAIPSRRRLVRSLALAAVVGLAVYYPLFKDRYGTLAEPARAITSQFSPDSRDKSSNEYRLAEEADLYATIKSEPILGYGYGKPMFHAVPIADISKTYAWWDIMPHNQILWVWMRVGTLGFIAFWLMIVAIVFKSASIVKSGGANEGKSTPIIALVTVSLLLVFGLLDLQLSNFRDVLFAGFWIGILAALPLKAPSSASEAS